MILLLLLFASFFGAHTDTSGRNDGNKRSGYGFLSGRTSKKRSDNKDGKTSDKYVIKGNVIIRKIFCYLYYIFRMFLCLIKKTLCLIKRFIEKLLIGLRRSLCSIKFMFRCPKCVLRQILCGSIRRFKFLLDRLICLLLKIICSYKRISKARIYKHSNATYIESSESDVVVTTEEEKVSKKFEEQFEEQISTPEPTAIFTPRPVAEQTRTPTPTPTVKPVVTPTPKPAEESKHTWKWSYTHTSTPSPTPQQTVKFEPKGEQTKSHTPTPTPIRVPEQTNVQSYTEADISASQAEISFFSISYLIEAIRGFCCLMVHIYRGIVDYVTYSRNDSVLLTIVCFFYRLILGTIAMIRAIIQSICWTIIHFFKGVRAIVQPIIDFFSYGLNYGVVRYVLCLLVRTVKLLLGPIRLLCSIPTLAENAMYEKIEYKKQYVQVKNEDDEIDPLVSVTQEDLNNWQNDQKVFEELVRKYNNMVDESIKDTQNKISHIIESIKNQVRSEEVFSANKDKREVVSTYNNPEYNTNMLKKAKIRLEKATVFGTQHKPDFRSIFGKIEHKKSANNMYYLGGPTGNFTYIVESGEPVRAVALRLKHVDKICSIKTVAFAFLDGENLVLLTGAKLLERNEDLMFELPASVSCDRFKLIVLSNYGDEKDTCLSDTELFYV